MTSLAGRTVAITGGAQGIGRATAVALAARGARVAIGDLDGPAAVRLAADLGADAVGVACDVADAASVHAFVAEVQQRLGPLDVLVNNAGVMLVGRPTWEEDPAGTRRQVDVNVHGVLHGIAAAVPGMVHRRRGHVVNVASAAGVVPFAHAATYSGTKHFVVGLSDALRDELRGSGVAVTCVIPGIVDTALATGHASVRGVRVVTAETVADAIVRAIERPRPDVHVPAEIAVLRRLHAWLPRPVFGALARATGADGLMAATDHDARAPYQRAIVDAGRRASDARAATPDPTPTESTIA